MIYPLAAAHAAMSYGAHAKNKAAAGGSCWHGARRSECEICAAVRRETGGLLTTEAPVPVEPEVPALAAHAKIDRLEATMRAMPPAEIETRHYFTEGGVYAREITIPAGTLLTGKVHKTEHLNILSKGTITVYSVTEEPRTLSAPATFVAAPGSRRVGYCHTEVVWTTIHASEGERDLAALEQRLIEPRGLLEGEEDKAMLEETLHLMIGGAV